MPAPSLTANSSFSSQWMPYGVALGLILVGLYEAKTILDLKSKLATANGSIKKLAESNALIGLRLVVLQPRDPAYASATIAIAWDAQQDRGVISVEDLPPPPSGQSYRLWVLDPKAAAPIGVGVVSPREESQRFETTMINSPSPGFAVSLEPIGVQTTNAGPVLFAVSPGS